ncbi:hypothetical protein [Antrihabitans spumae]|uniref:Uncharacterized protein n=1 Tax=Antrihabitans spumae TaxID=3373370 RepID=A0ABW7K834_9NOCA
MPYVALGLIAFVLWLYCLVDVITCPEHSVRNLPKLAWLAQIFLRADVPA